MWFILFSYLIGWENSQAAGISIEFSVTPPDVEPEVDPETKI